MALFNVKKVKLAVNFVSVDVRAASVDVRFASVYVRGASVDVSQVSVKGSVVFKNGMFPLVKVRVYFKSVSLISVSGNFIFQKVKTTTMTVKEAQLSANECQAHWARAKRQQHLPKELVL